MIFDKNTLWIMPEYQRKSPGHLIINAKCQQCSRLCTISSVIPGGYPYVYVEKLAAVFSLLCEEQAKVNPEDPADGQPSLSSDASEVNDV